MVPPHPGPLPRKQRGGEGEKMTTTFNRTLGHPPCCESLPACGKNPSPCCAGLPAGSSVHSNFWTPRVLRCATRGLTWTHLRDTLSNLGTPPRLRRLRPTVGTRRRQKPPGKPAKNSALQPTRSAVSPLAAADCPKTGKSRTPQQADPPSQPADCPTPHPECPTPPAGRPTEHGGREPHPYRRPHWESFAANPTWGTGGLEMLEWADFTTSGQKVCTTDSVISRRVAAGAAGPGSCAGSSSLSWSSRS